MNKYTALTKFLHDQLGVVEEGQIVEMNPGQAQTPLMFGWIEPVAVQSEEKPAAAPARRGRKPKDAE